LAAANASSPHGYQSTGLSYRAPCVIDGEAIEIGSAVTTCMACSPSVMEQEARFFGLLAEARSFRVRDGDTLELFGGEGERLLQFNRL
jgi:heat shock protein HslJ